MESKNNATFRCFIIIIIILCFFFAVILSSFIYTGGQAFILCIKDIINTTTRSSIISSIGWLFGELEGNHNKASILKKYNVHKVILNVMNKWSRDSVISNCIYIFACMAQCDIDTRIAFLNERILEQVRLELDEAYNCITLGRYSIEIWENASYFIVNMSMRNQDHYQYHELDKQHLIHSLIRTFQKGLQYLCMINTNEIKYINTRQYEMKQDMMNILFVNIFSSIICIYRYHSSICDELFSSLRSYNLLEYIIQFIDYTYDINSDSKQHVSLHAINVCTTILRHDNDDQIQALVDYKILDILRYDVNNKEMTLCLLYFLAEIASNIKFNELLQKYTLNEIICDCLECDEEEICENALYIVENALRPQVYFKSFCRLLSRSNFINNKTSIQIKILSILKNTATALISHQLDKSVIVIFNEFKFYDSLSKLQLSNVDFLKKNEWIEFEFYVSYLLKQAEV